ncbi:Gfo/Idh/MocA family protein [Streptomyces sp. NPDC002519]
MDVSVIGAGLMGRIHLDAWIRTGARVRVHDTDDERAAALAAQFGVEVVDTIDAALDGAEAVDICCPTSCHRDIALAAIAAGIPVVCEKPLAATAAEAEEIVAAAEAAGVPVYPAHGTRFAPAYARLRELVAAGTGAGAVGRFTSVGYHPRAYSETLTARSGGVLTDAMAHGVDLAHWVFGEVTRVHATYRGALATPAPAGTVAIGSAVLTHAGGAISQVVCGWAPEPTRHRSTFHVSGDRGSLRYDSTWPQPLRVTGGSVADVPRAFGESPFVAQIREFAAAVNGGPEPRVTGRDAVAVAWITEAAAESAWTGRAIDLHSHSHSYGNHGMEGGQ